MILLNILEVTDQQLNKFLFVHYEVFKHLKVRVLFKRAHEPRKDKHHLEGVSTKSSWNTSTWNELAIDVNNVHIQYVFFHITLINESRFNFFFKLSKLFLFSQPLSFFFAAKLVGNFLFICSDFILLNFLSSLIFFFYCVGMSFQGLLIPLIDCLMNIYKVRRLFFKVANHLFKQPRVNLLVNDLFSWLS